MPGLVLVVDDVPANVKLLEAKLNKEYYDVITAENGFKAIEQAKEHKPDLILLDVMMPEMDGFETCRKLKEDADVSHIPVVMVTALSEKSDRIQGLESGADDFITKPINDLALFARVKSLIRMKVLIDELRLRDQSGSQLGLDSPEAIDVSGSKILVIDDDAVQTKRMKENVGDMYDVTVFEQHEPALEEAKKAEMDLIIISTQLAEIDGLRLATQFKAIEAIRHVPIIMLVDEDDQELMLKALELGVNDYLIIPLDYNEMFARVKTQIRRKKYQDALKSNYQESVSMAITDGLTKLYNRHYLDTHMANLVQQSKENGKPMAVAMMDMDHFKSVNDTYGHDVGDEILIELAKRIVDSLRSTDLAARYGGEEFVVLMPETDFRNGWEVAERIRRNIENTPFTVTHEVGSLSKTISVGVAYMEGEHDSPEAMLKRADNALYVCKEHGRNQVQPRVGDNGLPVMSASDSAPPSSPASQETAPLQSLTPPPAEGAAPAVPATGEVTYNPNLVQDVPQTATSATPVDLTAKLKEREPTIFELKTDGMANPPAPQPSGTSSSDDHQIDDEPPGTF